MNEVENALINTTDLFATISELTGNSMPEINDSKSFKNLLNDSNVDARDYIYTEIGNETNGSDYTIRNATHKYMLLDNGTERFYNLSNNAFENPNLLNVNQLPLSTQDEAIMSELISELDVIRNQ